jgi:uncharacterized protein
MATLRFHVVPNAKVDSVVGEYGAAIKIKLRAPAVEGKANAALRSFLSKELNIAERQIVLEHGHKSREKIIRIEDLSDEEVRSHLRAAKLSISLSGLESAELAWSAPGSSSRSLQQSRGKTRRRVPVNL